MDRDLRDSLIVVAAIVIGTVVTWFAIGLILPSKAHAYACHYVRVCDGPGMSSCRLLWICE